jgi:KaiC/GvpD/RAD55 family RecA-like ATPase
VYYQSTLSPRVAQAENAKSPKRSAFPDFAGITLNHLAPLPVWLAWQNELLPGRKRPAKVPYAASMCRAATDDPATWGTKEQAIQLYKQLPLPCGDGGLGLVLTDIGGGYWVCGIDLDTCRAEDGSIAGWATEIIEPFASYTEISPSGTGVKIFFILKTGDLAGLRNEIGNQHKKTWSRGGGEHPPAIELHLSNSYFTITEQHVEGTPQELRLVEVDSLLWLIREAGPAFAGNREGDLSRHQKIHDQSRSAVAYRKGTALLRQGYSFEEMCAALRTDPETADWYWEKGVKDNNRELRRIHEAAVSTLGHDRPLIETIRFADMTARLDGRPLVKGFLEREQLSLWYGESGCGKTFLALDLALHVALGWDWFGRKVSQGPVVYVAAEAGRSIANRVMAFRIKYRLREAPFMAITSPVDLCHAGNDIARLIGAIRKFEPVLVVIDTVSRALAGGNENAPDDMGSFVRSVDRLRDELGCHVLMIHHAGKDASRGSRGHSLLRCAVDTEVEISMDDEDGQATVMKQRDGATVGSVAFQLFGMELGQNADNEPVTSCIVKPAAPKVTGQAQTALETLQKVLVEHGHTCVEGPLKGKTVVALDVWRNACKHGGEMGKNNATFRQAWKRARATLVAKGAVDIDTGNKWVHTDEM